MTKIDIISGFLGAGKTTLIKKLIEQAFKGEKLVLIENEFGEIGIDGGFLKDAGVQITEMNSGCICCSLVGDFGTALKQVITDYTPDRIIIEPSGVGKLSDVIKAVKDVSGDLDVELDSYTTVADVSKVKIYMKNFGEFFNNQIESANTIILSRTQTTTQDKIEKAVAMIREKNDHATIITTPWDEIDGAAIREAMQNYKSLEETMMDEAKKGHDHDHDHGDEGTCGCHDHDHHHESLLSGHDRPVHSDLKLSIENLSVSFGRKTVLSDVSADIAGGELVSVIGQNGCGKTTLLKAVAGLVKATGRVLATENGKTLSNSAVAYVPQLTAVQSRLTLFEMVLLGLVNDLSLTVDGKTFDRVDAVLHAMHINELASEPVLSLSGGQKQLVFMAQACVSSPRVLLLDEPTSALDLRHQLIVMQAARRYTERTGAATVCVVHDLMAAARFSDRLIMLDHGRVRACGTPKEVLKPDMLEAVYRVSTHVGLTEPGFINVVPIEPL